MFKNLINNYILKGKIDILKCRHQKRKFSLYIIIDHRLY